MTETDFVLWREKHNEMKERISQKRALLDQMERKLYQDEKDALQQAYESGLLKFRLGDFVEELKAQRKGIKNITLIDDVTCFSGKQKITYKDEIGMGSRIFLGVNIFADGHHLMRLDGFQLSPYDTLANGMIVLDAIKDNGCDNMLMFKSEKLLQDAIVNFDPKSNVMCNHTDVRDVVFAIVEKKAGISAENKSKG